MGFVLNKDNAYIINGQYGRIIEENEDSALFSTPHGSTVEILKIKEDSKKDSENAIKLHQAEANAKRLGMFYGKPYKDNERGHTGAGAKKKNKK